MKDHPTPEPAHDCLCGGDKWCPCPCHKQPSPAQGTAEPTNVTEARPASSAGERQAEVTPFFNIVRVVAIAWIVLLAYKHLKLLSPLLLVDGLLLGFMLYGAFVDAVLFRNEGRDAE